MLSEEIFNRIAAIISDYRNGEFGLYDSQHVRTWISQFENDEQEIVLLETLKILELNYITRDKFIAFINDLIDSDVVCVGDKASYWSKVSLLDIQKNGNSQDELNQILECIISKRYKINDLVGKCSDEFIYLDDFIFSGNRLFSDMQDWILNSAPYKCRICILTIGWFMYGQWDVESRLNKIASNCGKNVKFEFASYTEFRLENRLFRKDLSEVFWPTESITTLDGYTNWRLGEIFEPKYRIANSVENKIFSLLRREQYEKIMFKYGLKIMGFSSKNSGVVKPLGYSTFKGFGFGSTVFSFRNCPNNNPLAFWWGDPKSSSSHPFSKWYPLLQRKTYGI